MSGSLFTESNYRELVGLAKRHWRFARFTDAVDQGRMCLWRHDVDCSMHRALRLATIEKAEGVIATYFIHLHSCFYNALEPEIAQLVRDIAGLGHDIGLHFDPAFCAGIGMASRLSSVMRMERDLLECVAGVPVRAFSFHNPDIGDWMSLDDDEIEGMVNAYGRRIKDGFSYVSDSNGYWRFRDLRTVLEEATDARLHVLTHPEWWPPEAASPRERITRCIDGRAQHQHRLYDEALESMGRVNVR